MKSIWYDIKMLHPHVNEKKVNGFLIAIKQARLKIANEVTVKELNANLSFSFVDKVSNKEIHKLIINNAKFNYNKFICLLEHRGVINVSCKCSSIIVDGKSVGQFLKDLYYSKIL